MRMTMKALAGLVHHAARECGLHALVASALAGTAAFAFAPIIDAAKEAVYTAGIACLATAVWHGVKHRH